MAGTPGARPDAIAEALHYRLVRIGGGRAEAEWRPSAPWVNMRGGVFGGAASALIDVVAGLAIASTAGEKIGHLPTVSMHVDYLRPLTVGQLHYVRGETLRVGRRLAVADALIVDEQDTLLVRGTVTMALVARAVSDPARG